jgi:hypothetical protein
VAIAALGRERPMGDRLMDDVKSRADVVAERLATWAPDLDEIQRTHEQQAADQAAFDEAAKAIGELQQRALDRFAYVENCAALGVTPEPDPVADEAIAILEQLVADQVIDLD